MYTPSVDDTPQMMKTHPRLAHPPLVEALFEMRFQPKSPYTLLPGRLYDQLADSFPDAEELNVGIPIQLPPIPGMPPIVRHRFSRDQNTRMYQVGPGVLSINHTDYSTFEFFLEDIRRVISALLKLGHAGGVTRLGLRYINRMPLDRPVVDIVVAKFELPAILQDHAQGWTAVAELAFGDDTMNVACATVNADGREMLQLDTDLFRDAIPDALGFDAIIEWIERAHERVYQVFVAMLQPHYFEEIS